MKSKILVIAFFIAIKIDCIQIVKGNSSINNGFSAPISASAFDPQTGTFFVGLDTDSGESTNEYAISKALRPTLHSSYRFEPIAQNVLTNNSIEFLTLSQHKTHPILVAVEKSPSGNPFESTTITLLSTNGTSPTPITTNEILDSNGNTTEGITSIASSEHYVVSAVRPSGDNFGADGSGISFIIINRQSNRMIQFIQDGNAEPITTDSSLLTDSTITFLQDDDKNRVTIHYDDILDLFYIGFAIQTSADDGAIGKSVIIGQITTDEDGLATLNLKPIISDNDIINFFNNAMIPNQLGIFHNIVASMGNNLNIRTTHIDTLHASTGPDYLIVNGTVSTNDDGIQNNVIFALPIINNPDDLESHGQIAKPELSFLNKFTQLPETANELTTQLEANAQVGAGPLPIQIGTEIGQMKVIGDTVYVSLPNESDEDETGIFFSQAQYNAEGKIVAWTPWAKRAVAFDSLETGVINHFAPDPVTGNIWVAQNAPETFVGITSWANTSTQENGLLSKLNAALSEGCFSALDLDQATRGFFLRNTGDQENIPGQTNTEHRYALFGGNNKVIFTRISQAIAETPFAAPQNVITDFSLSENFLVSHLPQNAGIVTHLAYSKQGELGPIGDDEELLANFFFAGTPNGLYVFSNPDGTGFPVTDLGTLNLSPFATGVWNKIPTISGSIKDLRCEGNALYVLTSNFTPEQPFIDTLYMIPFTPNGDASKNSIDTLFANDNIFILAQNGIDIFSDVVSFNSIGIFATFADFNFAPGNLPTYTAEQLSLATSNGLFTSDATQTVTISEEGIVQLNLQGTPDAKNQTDMKWSRIATTEGSVFLWTGFTDSPVHHTLWPISLQDPTIYKRFNFGKINQISGSKIDMTNNYNPKIGTLVPSNFISNESLAFIDPISYVWTDGARRFFILNKTNDPSQENKLASLPFDTDRFTLGTSIDIQHPIVKKQKRFYWIQMIGATGLLCVGTNNGVIALQ